MPEELDPPPKATMPRSVVVIFSLVMLLLLLFANPLTPVILRETFYQTNQPEEISTTELEGLEWLSVPIDVYIVRDSDPISTARTEQDIDEVMQNADKIWEQAKINLEYTIQETSFEPEAASEINLGNYSSLKPRTATDPNFNMYFIREINGPYGIATSFGISLVADVIPLNSFRTTAHEIGHLLGLVHTTASNTLLMFSGENGITLTKDEILFARKTAETLFPTSLRPTPAQ